MSISFIGAQGVAGNAVTIPAHQVGDLILIFAYRDGNANAPTVPAAGGTVPTWTIIGAAAGANSNASRLHYAVATATTTTSGTWTNATELIAIVYRGTRRPGGNGEGGNLGTVITYPAVTMQRADNSSWVARFGGHRSATNVELAPTGMLNRTSIGTETAVHDTNGTVSSSSATNVTVNASSGWRARTVELLDSSLRLLADVGTFNDTFVDAVFARGFALTAAAGTVSFVGQDAALAVPFRLIRSDSGTISLTGTDAGLRHTARLRADVRTYSLTGFIIDIRPARRLVAALQAFSLTGVSAGLRQTARLLAESGSFTRTGNSAGTRAGKRLLAQQRAFSIAGLGATLFKGGGLSRSLAAWTANYSLSANPATLQRRVPLLAGVGSLLLVGQSAQLPVLHNLAAATGSFDLLVDEPQTSLFVAWLLSSLTGEFNAAGSEAFFAADTPFVADSVDLELLGQSITFLHDCILRAETYELQSAGNESYNRIRKLPRPQTVLAGDFIDLYPFYKARRLRQRKQPSVKDIAPRFSP
ncbi:hypothetical protein [Cyanobium sp. A2C-AMD]|uniref:hypothetical protein n=1 Tax=Cyanobium sp. A2C-AMD TaxID=2823695 RepID=UPI0020CC7562|nr:hypothetical protein [Cyanobium sp. A2C-AMD]MCP9876034.1 hypothetical protein [Cyanobium sp. A2C-AMD]